MQLQGQGKNPIVHGVAVELRSDVGAAVGPRLVKDLQPTAIGQLYTLAQPASGAESIQHPGHRPRVLTQFGGFPFEAIDLFDDFNRDQNGVVRKILQGVRVVQEDVGVENVILHNGSKVVAAQLDAAMEEAAGTRRVRP